MREDSSVRSLARSVRAGALLVALAQTTACKSSLDAVIEEVDGPVEVQMDADASWSRASAGMRLDVESKVRSPAGTSATIVYGIGTNLRLEGGTEVELLSPEGGVIPVYIGEGMLTVLQPTGGAIAIRTATQPVLRVDSAGGSLDARFRSVGDPDPAVDVVARTKLKATLGGKTLVLEPGRAARLSHGELVALERFQEFAVEPEDVRVRLSEKWGGLVLSEASSGVTIRKAGSAKWVAATAGEKIGPEDEVRTAKGANAVALYDDGTEVVVKPGTILLFRESAQDVAGKTRVAAVEVKAGELIARVGGGGDGSSTLRIVGGDGMVRLAGEKKGKEVVVRVGQGVMSVAASMGAAELISRTGARSDIRESESVRVTPKGLEWVARARAGGGERIGSGSDQKRGPTRGRVELLGNEILRVDQDKSAVLQWRPYVGAQKYELQVATNASFSRMYLKERTSKTSFQLYYEKYPALFWRVRALPIEGRPSQFSSAHRVEFVRRDTRPEGNFMGSGRSAGRSREPIEILSPANRAVLRRSPIQLRGLAQPGASIVVNGRGTAVSGEGNFSALVKLKPGLNQIVVESRGDGGRVRHKTLTVFFKPN